MTFLAILEKEEEVTPSPSVYPHSKHRFQEFDIKTINISSNWLSINVKIFVSHGQMANVSAFPPQPPQVDEKVLK